MGLHRLGSSIIFAAYVLYAAVRGLLVLFMCICYYTVPSCRPRESWTFFQASANCACRQFLDFVAAAKIKTSQIKSVAKSLGHFVLISPLTEEELLGPAKDDTILPLPVGAVWVPCKPTNACSKPGQLVTLHFHGGAYIMVTPGLKNAQTGPRMLAEQADFPVLMIDYRLACNEGGRHPAALQDAVAGYRHLLEQGYEPSNIILSGDSAGGHLSLMLLRYITEFGKDAGLPVPLGVALWSPWCDQTADPDDPDKIPNADSDYVTFDLVQWALRCFLPPGVSAEQPYLSPGKYPFATAAKLYFHAGTAEVVHKQVLVAVDNFRSVPGNVVKYDETVDTVHDLFAAGGDLGFRKEQKMIIRAAVKFFRA